MRIVRYARIRDRDEEGNRAPLWLMGITDLVTLLLAFFILLFATSIPNSDVWDKASDSMRSRFGGALDGSAITGEAGHDDADMTWKSEDRNPGLDLDYLYSIVKRYIESDPALADISVWTDHDKVVLSLGEALIFAPGQTEISAQGKNSLYRLADYLDRLPNTLEVVGYADNLPLRSDQNFNSNWHLSLARADSVAQELTRRGYEAPIAVRGKGISTPDILLNTGKQGSGEKTVTNLVRRVDLRLYLLQP